MLYPTSEGGTAARLAAHPRNDPFTRLFAHAYRRKGLLASAVLFGFVASGIALCFVTPIYEAQAVVIVDSRRNKLADAEGALSSIVVDQFQSSLKSELELIRSPALARDVITSLGLLDTEDYETAHTHTSTASKFEAMRQRLVDSIRSLLAKLEGDGPPGTAELTRTAPGSTPPSGIGHDEVVMQSAIKLFGKSFWCENDPKSLTIRMGYKSASPELAAAVTNAALRHYLEADEAVKAAAVARSEAWLRRRIVQLRIDLDASERLVEEFRTTHDLATMRDRSPTQQSLLQLEAQMVEARAGLAAAQAKAAQGRDQSTAVGADALSSRLIQSLRQQEASLASQQSQLAVTLLPNHPSVTRLNEQLAAIRGAIRVELDRIKQSNQSDVRLAQQRVADVAQQVDAVRRKIATANVDDIRLRSLEADAAAKRSVLNTLTQRFEQDAGPPLTAPDSRVVSWASVPVDASWPKYGLMLAAGASAFTGLAFLLTLGLERLRRGFDGPQELEDELNLVVAGVTPRIPAVTARRQQRPAKEAAPVRELATTMRALARTAVSTGATQVLLVTSSIAGEGKSTLAASLARSAAAAGQRVVLIDADIRKPTLHTQLGCPAAPGLADVLLDRMPVGSAVHQVAGEPFHFLAAGRPVHEALGSFTFDAFGGPLAELRARFDVIVLDSAPVLLAAESLVLVGAADMTLFAVKWRTTPREVARKATNLIGRCSAGPCLAVLSQADLKRIRKGGRIEDRYGAPYATT